MRRPPVLRHAWRFPVFPAKTRVTLTPRPCVINGKRPHVKTYALLAFAGIAATGFAIAFLVRRYRGARGTASTRAPETEFEEATTAESIAPVGATGESPTAAPFESDESASGPPTAPYT